MTSQVDVPRLRRLRARACQVITSAGGNIEARVRRVDTELHPVHPFMRELLDDACLCDLVVAVNAGDRLAQDRLRAAIAARMRTRVVLTACAADYLARALESDDPSAAFARTNRRGSDSLKHAWRHANALHLVRFLYGERGDRALALAECASLIDYTVKGLKEALTEPALDEALAFERHAHQLLELAGPAIVACDWFISDFCRK